MTKINIVKNILSNRVIVLTVNTITLCNVLIPEQVLGNHNFGFENNKESDEPYYKMIVLESQYRWEIIYKIGAENCTIEISACRVRGPVEINGRIHRRWIRSLTPKYTTKSKDSGGTFARKKILDTHGFLYQIV